MATGSPVKPWERNGTTTQRRPSPLSTTSLPQNTMSSAPSLPSRPSTMAGRSPYSSSSMYGGSSSMYGSSYGGGYGASSYGGGYGASSYGGGYGSSLSRYGGMGGYGSSYGMGGMSGYGSSYGGRGSMYGSRYGGSGFGSSYGGGYGGGYGSTYSRLGMGYDDNSYRNPYPRGKYWSYGSEPELDEFGNPIDDESALQNGKNWLMEMEHVVDGFGHFTRILDYNFDAIHGSFASVIRLFDSFSELRRAIYYGLQGLAIFTLLSKLFAAFQRFLYKLLGKPIPANLSSNFKEAVDSLEDQWSPNVTTARRLTDPANGGKRSSRPLLLLLGFFFVILGGPVILNALYRAFVPRKNVPRPQNLRVKPQVQAIHDFQGQAEGDLSFKKGDIITIRRQVDEGWLEGETSDGVIGLVPITYVQRMRPTRPTPAPGGPGRQVPGVATPPPNVAAGRTNQTPDAVWESTNAPVS